VHSAHREPSTGQKANHRVDGWVLAAIFLLAIVLAARFALSLLGPG
jgi:hypothetical protein